MENVIRGLIWIVIGVSFVRGLWAFDGGGSANTHETTAAAVLFGAALIASVLMLCFDLKTRDSKRPS